MNKGPILQLSLSHAVTIMGLVIGCLVAAFVIGYRAGRASGYEEAASSTLANVPRFQIPESEQPSEVSEEFVKKVYSRLQENIEGPRDGKAPPKLEKITQVIPDPKPLPLTKDAKKLGDIAPKEKKNEKGKGKVAEKKKEKETKKVDPKVVEQEEEKENEKEKEKKGKTLGGLFELSNSEDKAPEKVKEETKKIQVAEVRKIPPPTAVAPTPRSTPQLLKPQVVRRGWYVQVAAPGDANEANSLLKKLNENGFRDVAIQSANVRGKTYHRVLVGPEDTSVLAQRLLEQLKREPYIKLKPYLKRVK